MPTSWEKTCGCHLQVTKGPISKLPNKPELQWLPSPWVSVHSKFKLPFQHFLSLLRKQAMLSGPSPPSFSPYNWVQCVLNSEEASARYEMKQIRRQTAKGAAVFLICRYHFGDCGESFTSSHWKSNALEREPEVAGRNAQLSPCSIAMAWGSNWLKTEGRELAVRTCQIFLKVSKSLKVVDFFP